MSSNNTANSRDKSEEAESEEAVSLAKKDTVPVTPDAEKADNQVPRPFPCVMANNPYYGTMRV